jgi:hypothetical protein
MTAKCAGVVATLGFGRKLVGQRHQLPGSRSMLLERIRIASNTNRLPSSSSSTTISSTLPSWSDREATWSAGLSFRSERITDKRVLDRAKDVFVGDAVPADLHKPSVAPPRG